jgi:hemoglobin
MTQTLYDKLGGFSFVRKLVSSFYDRLLDEDTLSPFFEDIDMRALVDHQTKFWATALGGPASYTPEQLRTIHQSMDIEAHHFDLVLDLVEETLEDHDVADEDVAAIVQAFEGYRPIIIGGTGSHG